MNQSGHGHRDVAADAADVRLSNVGKQFGAGLEVVEAIREISFEVAAGSFVSLVGESGCGKTTVLKMIGGLVDATRGSVFVRGEEVQGPTAGLGMVFQSPTLLDWRDVLGNVMLPIEILGLELEGGQERARRLIDMVGLSDFVRRFPPELSGGMQQRVAIARALVSNPPLLVMDEPFGALDALTREELRWELLRIWGDTGKTIVFVTHDIEEAVLLSDRVVVFSRRPSTVAAVVDINLPRPRTTATKSVSEFTKLAETIRNGIYSAGRSQGGVV